jgi:hypothetical protein
MSHIALSYSRLSTYEQCPEKFKSQYLDKDYPDEGENFHFIKGSKKHGQLDNYIKCKNDPTMINMMYDGDVLSAVPIVDSLLKAGFEIVSEQQLAVDLKFMPITWFSKETMYRAICDFVAVRFDEAIVGDWKTGKFRDYDGSKTGQLHLAAAIVFAHHPNVETIKTSYFFIEHKQTIIRQFTREMYVDGLLIPFYTSFKRVNEDKKFAPKRNQYCNWCLRNKKNEGTCTLGL